MTDGQLYRLQRLFYRLPPSERPTVVFKNQTAPGVYSQQSVQAVVRDAGLMEADDSKGVYVKQLYDIYFPRWVVTTKPTPGDLVTYQAFDHVVLPDGVSSDMANGLWKCRAGRFSFQDGLAITFGITRPQPTKDSTGRLRTGTPVVIASNVPGWIQDVDTFAQVAVTVGDSLGKLQNPVLARVWFFSTIRAQAHDLLTDSTGQKWEILGDFNIGKLAQAQAMQIRRFA